ncbi:8-amino-7-oxononanoate synthase [Arenibacter nanhaiticus]|uniref:8-amino-7-oxononanoate synthase n=1 Tax=Arenibacter nanhaiticus TaxID=558155 RepID=A0A1M6JHK1_9FLAO|nr:8-amino-7-oxononanoate synthase [Arenibacter nanhaiticus]SHJ46153.1 8-amino-7-oxononanoate synthase [Arenibacter nanhaiticus]
MVELPKRLQIKLSERATNNALRQLPIANHLIDFSSNDYLGFARDEAVFKMASEILRNEGIRTNGATGSRLLTGNSELYGQLEALLAKFYDTEAALVFNSGYDANIGFFSSVPQRGDVVLYDELCHASIRDGIGMSNAQHYKFKHNDVEDLYRSIERVKSKNTDSIIYVVTESVFSMDGDAPDLEALAILCKANGCYLVVDEAHAVGVYGEKGEGLLHQLVQQDKVFARIITFGKAMGCHGAAILGSEALKSYLVNFARSFIYTTGLPPHSLATILAVHQRLENNGQVGTPFGGIQTLKNNIQFFNARLIALGLEQYFIPSNSAIHCCLVPGNKQVKYWSGQLREKGFDVKPIMSPTVPKGQERLRFCIHSYNSENQINSLLLHLEMLVHLSEK